MKKEYIKTRPKTVVDITRIVTIHYYEVDPHFVFEGERHDFWELVYVDKGSVAIQRDDEEIVLQQGQVVFHRPNEFHAIRSLDSAPNFFVISFASSSPAMTHFEGYCAPLERGRKSLLSSIIKEAEATYLIPKNDPDLRRLHRRYEAPLGGEQLIKTYLEQLLISLLRSMENNDNASRLPQWAVEEQPLVASLKEYLTARCEDTVRVDDVCRAFGYSKSFLSRLFREHTGETIAAFAVARKMERAKELLRQDDLNVAQISSQLSFESPQYFARAFKRQFGMTPTEFKNRAHR